ncbi:hypothetical protein E0H75_35960 [Kribbella capetownensis]|uniref:MmyB-like transcription regulator ligand binding domain-containing protein n=1 Tax=Kribbella capetownensis TaxID=1572659 RepID=A0A4R0JD64_9ACTN|nr:hypothetical protein [Kribbella capetownensis]TCC44249.1 hypothetical protein E0H75_35960 [Kribbella capetownensis]
MEEALASMLEQHEPYPAVVMDRGWNVLRANRGASRLFGTLLAPDPLPDPANVLRLMIEPGPVRAAVVNWSSVAPALLERAAREAVAGVFDRETAELVRRLRSRPDVSAVLTGPSVTAPSVPVIDVQFALGDLEVELFSVVSAIGTPTDVTAQELRVEDFFPANQPTRDAWHQLTTAGPRSARERSTAEGPWSSKQATSSSPHPVDD